MSADAWWRLPGTWVLNQHRMFTRSSLQNQVADHAASSKYFEVGGIVLALTGPCGDSISIPSDTSRFAVVPCAPEIEIRVDWRDSLEPATGEALFDSGGVWRLFREGKSQTFDFVSPIVGSSPYKKLLVDSTFRTGQILLNRALLADFGPISPIEYPADELLITNFLAQGFGVEVHGCGLLDAATGGHLFVGHSGAGKSTTTRLWQRQRNPEVLSDDRIILRLHDGALWMYGTPWHGEVALCSPARARISRIFVLQHGEQNRMTLLPPAQAVGELFARSFPPFYSPSSIELTMEFLATVAKNVPCYEFSFLADSSAVNAVLDFHD